MPSLRKLFSRSHAWLTVCVGAIACNSIFDIQDPIERPTSGAASCILNSNCPSGKVCLFQLCSPPCATDIDCPSASSRCLHTNDGTACVTETQGSCTDAGAADCPSGTVCVAAACYSECTDSSDCITGYRCDEGACKAAPSNTGGATGAGGGSGAPPMGEAGSAAAGEGNGGESGESGGEAGESGAGPVSVCIAKARTCANNAIETCNDDGTAYLAQLEPCSAKQTCVLGACKDQECAPGADFCSGKAVRTCAENGLSSSELKTCSASQYCDTASATCKDGICAPSQPACNGNTATTCTANGSGYAAGGTACKATETCEGGSCVAHVCTPGATSCSGQDLKKCAADGLGSTIDSTCSASKTCVASGVTASCTGVCGPGQTNCAGNGVQLCGADGFWGATSACKTNQTCASGACVACPNKTLNCDDNSLNGCETDPAAASSCGSTCANVVLCSTQHGSPSCGTGVCGISCSQPYLDCSGTNDGCETNGATDPNSCGGCGKTCSSNHVASRTCASSVCNGTCATGYDDCDTNKQSNGCETNLQNDAAHCGGCTNICKYRSCTAGACTATTWGNNAITPVPTTTKLAKNTLWTFKLSVTPNGASTTLLEALGIVVVVDGANPSAKVRIGLYTDSGASSPNTLEAQTSPLVTVNGVNEQVLASAVSIPSGTHWIAFLADQDIRLHVDAASISWAAASVTFAGATSLPSPFPLPTGYSVERGHLFAVTTP
ncbi:MAG: hypothetical protein ABIQ16_27350 [Polyangiaceae bacterium]